MTAERLSGSGRDDAGGGSRGRRTPDTFSAILAEIDGEPVFDTHEHLWPLERLGSPMNLLGLLSNTYVARALRGADGSRNGVAPAPAIDASEPETWDVIRSIVERVRWTGYYRSLLLGLADLHGLDAGELTQDNWLALSRRVIDAYERPDWMATVLDRSRIAAVVWDPFWHPGDWLVAEERLLPSYRIDSALVGFDPEARDYTGANLVRDWSEAFGIEVRTLTDLESLIERVVDANRAAGSRSMKAAIAYDRSLDVARHPRREAERVMGTPSSKVSPEARRLFGDYIVRFCLDIARQHGLVFQVHTGLARLRDSNPLLLTGLIEDYPDVTFDLFHGGYPWVHESGALAQNYPNVRLNLTWLPQLSPSLAIEAIKEWLQVVPQRDRISWGGDSWVVEEMHGALLMAKRVAARAVADLVDEGYFGRQDALCAARSIIFTGGATIYGAGEGAQV